MPESVCAVVVTFNRKDLLRKCLQSLLGQTQVPDKILVVDNASSDGTAELLDSEFPSLERMRLATNTGGAGGFKAGMQWAYSQGYDWVWVMDDDIEIVPECLETMLQWRNIGDVIHVRKQLPWGPLIWESMWDVSAADTVTFDKDVSFCNGKKWTAVQYCNFEGALIKRFIIERAGLPDERYFIEGDDTIYGYLASLYGNVIFIDFVGILKNNAVQGPPKGRMRYYLSIRNRFLTYQHLVASGLRLNRRTFRLVMTIAAISKLKEAARSNDGKLANIRAVVDGFRDGWRSRFGPPPWIAKTGATTELPIVDSQKEGAIGNTRSASSTTRRTLSQAD